VSLLSTYYRGHDVLTLMPNGSADRPQTEDMPTDVVGGDVGQWAASWPVATPELDWPFSLVLDSRALVSDWLLWLSYRRGRYAPFWMPTWRRDFQLAADAGASDTELIVYTTGYPDAGFTTEARRHLAVIVAGGGARTVYPRRIEDAVDNLDGTETLTIDSAVGVALDHHVVLSHLILSRLADDTTTVHWYHPIAGITEVRVVELPRQMEETA
jgi:hypothetical protein